MKYRRKHIVAVRHQVYVGTLESYQAAVRAAGFTGRIQTAFIERLNLTIRRSIAGLARGSWSTAHSPSEWALQFEGWRAYDHFAGRLDAPPLDGAAGPDCPSAAQALRVGVEKNGGRGTANRCFGPDRTA